MERNQTLPDKDFIALSMINRSVICWKNEHCSPYSLTAAQLPIVVLACYYGKISQNEVVSLLGLDKSVVSKSVGTLIASGFLTKKKNPDDSRAYDLMPTAKSMKCFPELLLLGQSCMNLLTDGFSEEEKQVFSLLLEKMVRNAAKLKEPGSEHDFVNSRPDQKNGSVPDHAGSAG